MHHRYAFGFRIDDVQHAPVIHPNAPLILEAFKLFASCGPGVVGERQNLAVYPFEYRIVKRIEFLLRRLFQGCA